MPQTNSLRVLVVDDDPLMHEILKLMLLNLGLRDIETFGDGAGVLAWLQAPGNHADLVLLDLNMPTMDGIEVLRGLGALGFDGSVILASGEDELVLQTAEALVVQHRITALGHLRKPVQPSELSALIDRWKPDIRPRGSRVSRSYSQADFRRALALREFVNHYQPKVALATGRVVGVEALVRWRHGTEGLVFPDSFIGLAEEHGLIQGLTQIVFSQAVADLAAWRKAGIDLQVSVNLSMDCLAALDLPDILSSKARAADVAQQDIVLEITESRLAVLMVKVLDVLARLRLKRFKLSIDDFGTGHSSLTQLRDMPFDELKIDRSFVHGAAANGKKQAIVDASLGLARQLGIAVVAEGVEDSEDWQFLRERRCDFAQGYFIAKPMPADELPAWMEAWAMRIKDGF